ncbi:flagellar hook-basal body protein [Helicobacter sp. MIT 14-3879]|uniref:flagellar hook-basal body protein n=1 Tax=Helicobacter sp. MIT 14-3879 TaxID=2040649 RepID=UPI000E1EA471|nr:flagellar hook-basal body protein [Helicobacter sp. MIT 14-3879]RDU64852.1 flagellar biosynthesis protein FlgG [Helicobacter sp. MIT 14-3879]
MENGFYNATGGMVTQFNRLDVISNNLANTNTNGFKRDDVVIGDFMRLYEEYKHELPLKNHTREAAKFLNRTLNRVPIVVEEYSDISIGGFAKTENPLDLALNNKNAFFAIQTPNGVRYTRDGAFTIDNNGILVTKQGYPVLSKEGIDEEGFITIDASNNNLEVSKNGDIFIRNLSNENIGNPEPIGNIAIVNFINPKFLKKVGSNLYELPQDRINERQNINDNNAILSGFIEKSNINPVIEMTALISTNRLVDIYSKVMKTYQDDLATEAINKLAQNRA